MIKVVLKENIPGQGNKGDILNVSDGFARNYLLPQNKAIIATADAVKQTEQEQKLKSDREKNILEKNESLKDRLEKTNVEIKKKTKDGKLFGSVNAKDVIDALEAKGVKISPKSITIEKPIKSIGKHIIGVELDKKHKARLNLTVVEE
jgi:large subunit ribosomal protein L9